MDKSIRLRAPKLRVRPAYRRDGTLVWACHDKDNMAVGFGDSALEALRAFHGITPRQPGFRRLAA